MKKSEIANAVNILGTINLNKITDREVKATLINDYLHLRRIAKAAEEDQQEIARKFQEDFKDEIEEVQSIRSAGKTVKGHREFLKAEADANALIRDIYAAEAEVETQTVPLGKFLDAAKGTDITFEQVAQLEGIIIGE